MSTIEFERFVYTGNSPAGQNSGNHDEVVAWAQAAGLPIRSDNDLDMFWDGFQTVPGTHTKRLNGRTLIYTVDALGGRRDGFGQYLRCRLRAVEVR